MRAIPKLVRKTSSRYIQWARSISGGPSEATSKSSSVATSAVSHWNIVLPSRASFQTIPERCVVGGLAIRNRSDSSMTGNDRSEEHTSELQSLMLTSYAVFCLITKLTNANHVI